MAFEAEAKDGVGLQGLAGLGAIGNPGIQREQRQPGCFVELGPFVGIDKIAGVGLRETRRAGRQDVLQAVDQLDVTRCSPRVLQFALADKAVAVAGRPGVAKCQLEVVIDFFKAQLVAQHVLVEVAADRDNVRRAPG